jgi:DNA polymerase-3 subunit delta'
MWQVIGQTRALSLLKRSLEAGSLAHAYLFVGPAHVGKMALTVNLAQALNCEAAESPCGECPSCQRIASGKHADIQTIGLGQGTSAEARPRAEIGIDEIRQLQHSASLPPFEGKYKVFIIDGAELLSTEAANCLLKTLEEPVGKVVFILLTTNEQLLPLTVISRCQRVELLPLAAAEIESALEKNWGVEPQKARLLSRLSHGCLGWALRAQDDGLLNQRADRLGELIDIIQADYEGRFAGAAQLASEFGQSRELVQEKLALWLDWWRDLMLVKVGSTDLVTNVDQVATLTEMAKAYSLAQIRNAIENIRVAGAQLRLNANPRLVLEVLMLNLPEAVRKRVKNASAKFENTAERRS